MPKDTSIKKILVIGSGPIVIGQGCEFDYSGTQACKAPREEGYEVVLVNSNPATIMTDPETAPRTYIEPITPEFVEKIIVREKPDALLPTLGGQTALNCAMELHRSGVLERENVRMIGAHADAIDRGEDRNLFKEAMIRIGLDVPRSGIAHTMEEARRVAGDIGTFPLIIRPAFTLGGMGGGVAYNKTEFEEICARGLDLSPVSEILIEESLIGWKEFEMEVMRDRADNCVVICSIENIDAMGVHTGDSITVAPIQTLTDREYQVMRDASFAVIREIGVETGGSNIQFAINPANGRMIVIEMNPRVSRSSALASKATGFPIAKLAAKLAVGYTLDELRNDITRETPACFEPTIDYVVTKVPRFTFEKFKQADEHLTPSMKSVGEAMAIGRTFKESLQKALRSLETGRWGWGFDAKAPQKPTAEEITRKLAVPTAERIFWIQTAFSSGFSWTRCTSSPRLTPGSWPRCGTWRRRATAWTRWTCGKPRSWAFPTGRSPWPAELRRKASGKNAANRASCPATAWWTPAPRSLRHTRLTFIPRTGMKTRRATRAGRRSSSWEAARTASARASSSTTAACTPPWPCGKWGMKPSS